MTTPTAIRHRAGVILGSITLMAALVSLQSSPAHAANSPTYRDCSVLIGIDPDFVQLYGVTLTNGVLTAPLSHPTVQLEASESSDPGDNKGHDTFHVTASSTGVTSTTASGAATGLVLLTLALPSPRVGRTYTISWAATFDGGMHACPAIYTLANMPQKQNPFVVTVGH